jgi:hypothetical protein
MPIKKKSHSLMVRKALTCGKRNTQDGTIKVPTSGDAVMIFSLDYIGENMSQWLWEGVILQSTC